MFSLCCGSLLPLPKFQFRASGTFSRITTLGPKLTKQTRPKPDCFQCRVRKFQFLSSAALCSIQIRFASSNTAFGRGSLDCSRSSPEKNSFPI